MDPAEMSRPEKISQAIGLRARGHAWRYIGATLDTPESTVRLWLSTPEAMLDIARVAREITPSADHAADLAGAYLLAIVMGDELDVTSADRIKAAAVIMGNRQRMIEVTAKSREADAATSQATTADELAAMEIAAAEYLAEVQRRQGEGT